MAFHEKPETLSKLQPFIHTESLPKDLPAKQFISLLEQLHEKTGHFWGESQCKNATKITIWLNALLKVNNLNYEATTWIFGLDHQWTRLNLSNVIFDPFGVLESSRVIVPFFGSLDDLDSNKFPAAYKIYNQGKPHSKLSETMFLLFSD